MALCASRLIERQLIEKPPNIIDRKYVDVVYRVSLNLPLKRLRFKPGAVTVGAGTIRPVLRQKHADVHLVAFGLEPVEKPAKTVPLAILVVTFAFYNPLLFAFAERVPRDVGANTILFRKAKHVPLTFVVTLAFPHSNRTVAQALRPVGDDQLIINAHGSAEATTGWTGANRGVE